jgi:hypothetical protein
MPRARASIRVGVGALGDAFIAGDIMEVALREFPGRRCVLVEADTGRTSGRPEDVRVLRGIPLAGLRWSPWSMAE